MRQALLTMIVLVILSLAICSCKKEDEPEAETLLTMTQLMDTSTDWLIILGEGEDFNGLTTTDKYFIRYNGVDVPANVKLDINGVSYNLTSATRTKNYYFAGPTFPTFTAGETYTLKLTVANVTKAEYAIKMVAVPDLNAPTSFNSAQNHNFQWQISENSKVQYFYGKRPSNAQVLMAVMGGTIRQYSYLANTLATATGTWEFGILQANYAVVSNVRFVTMSADWVSVNHP